MKGLHHFLFVAGAVLHGADGAHREKESNDMVKAITLVSIVIFFLSFLFPPPPPTPHWMLEEYLLLLINLN